MRVAKPIEALFTLFPPSQAILIAFDLFRFLHAPNFVSAGRLVFSAYFLAPLVWLVLRLLFGRSSEGAFRVGKRAAGGNLWLLYYQLQVLYTSFPAFERVLKLFPGLYSAWLRLWGSRVGKNVNWTAECQIVDRGHLDIGDRAFLGNRSYLSAHALKKTKDRYFLYVKGIKVGDDAMVSYAAQVGPGSVIGSRAHVSAGAHLYPNTKVADGETYAYRQ